MLLEGTVHVEGVIMVYPQVPHHPRLQQRYFSAPKPLCYPYYVIYPRSTLEKMISHSLNSLAGLNRFSVIIPLFKGDFLSLSFMRLRAFSGGRDTILFLIHPFPHGAHVSLPPRPRAPVWCEGNKPTMKRRQ